MEDSYRRKGSLEWKSISQIFRRSRLFETIYVGVCSIGICLAGLWLTWQGLRILTLDRESSSWPSVNGRITYAQVDNRGNRGPHFVPSVGYIYQIGTQRHFANRIYPECAIGGSMSWAQSVIARHPAESTCVVYYSPTNPNWTTLEPGLAPHSFTFAGAGLMLTYTGMLLGFLALSIWRRPLNQKNSLASAFKILLLWGTVIIGFSFVAWLR